MILQVLGSSPGLDWTLCSNKVQLGISSHRAACRDLHKRYRDEHDMQDKLVRGGWNRPERDRR